MPEGLEVLTMEDALAASRTELEQASSDVVETGLPPAETDTPVNEEQSSPSTPEQPAAVSDGFSEDAQKLGDALMDTTEDSQNGSDPASITPGSEDFWNHTVDVETVNGPTAVTIKELSEGYLRQADYTQKTQNLAEQRKNVERATEFLSVFESDPVEFARSLAVQAGLLNEDDVPVKDFPIAKIPTQEELETKLNEMVEERVLADERVVSATEASARVEIDAEFDRISSEYDVELKSDLREDILIEAFKTGNADLEGILAKRIATHQRKQSKADATNLASTSRPGAAPTGATTPDSEKANDTPTMREAFQQAKVAAVQQ